MPSARASQFHLSHRLAVALTVAAGLCAPCAGAQDTPPSEYDARYGEPVSVTLWDLTQDPQAYDQRAVRTKGRLDFSFEGGASRSFALRDAMAGGTVLLRPARELSGLQRELDRLVGQEVEVTGAFFLNRGTGTAVERVVGTIMFWELEGPPEDVRGAGREKPELSTIEAVVTRAARSEGRRVRVVGQFRGANLFGDLPARSRLRAGDWVLKDDVWSLWVTGRKPRGQGFALDPGLKRDTGRWLEVVGRVGVRAQSVYLEAESVALTTAPAAGAAVAEPPPPPPAPKEPPVVVFSLPLDGESGVASDARFVVQFSKDMDEDSFRGRVQLRYAGPVRPGDRGFEGLTMSYDGGRRALTVDPGDALRPGRTLELWLLDGIQDTEGLALVPRAGPGREGVVDVLRFPGVGP